MKNIDFDKSFVFFNKSLKNSWRSKIKSLIKDQVSTYFLTTECRAENISSMPFSHPSISEFCPIVGLNNEVIYIRNAPFLKGDDFSSHNYQTQIKNKKNLEFKLSYSDYTLVPFENLFELMELNSDKKIYIRLNYQYQEKFFEIFFEANYINFNYKNFIQPIAGYIPFIYYNKFFISYIAFNQTKDTLVDFDVRLRKNNLASKSFNRDYSLKENLAVFLLNLLPFFKISEFTTYLTIKNAQVQYFIKT